CNRHFTPPRRGKSALRNTMAPPLPKEIANREKQGLSAPDPSWFNGESIDYVRRKLYPGSARIYDFMDAAAVRSLVDDHLEGRENRRLLIWSLLNLETWCENFLDGGRLH